MHPTEFFITAMMATLGLWNVTAWCYALALATLAALTIVIAIDTYIVAGRTPVSGVRP